MLMWISATIETIIGIVITIVKAFYIIGRIIAYSLASIGEYVITLSAVLAECAVIFCEDVNYQYSHIIRMLNNGLSNSINDILSVCDGILSSIAWTSNQIGSEFYRMTTGLNSVTVNCAVGLRDSIILMGDSTWMLLTFLPNLTIFIINRLIEIIHFGAVYAIKTIQTTSLRISNFIMDSASFLSSVPLQTICGLISIYFIVKYRRFFFSIFWASTISAMEFFFLITTQNLLFCQNIIAFMYEMFRLMGQFRNYLPSLSLSTCKSNHLCSDEDTQNDNGIPSFCVICQDQLKSIVLMPCRHLCLCKACYIQLKRYRHLCPVCRQPFVQTIQVYA